MEEKGCTDESIDCEKKQCIIVDLEGTLTNCAHRIHHYNNKNYDEWNDLFYKDLPNDDLLGILRKYQTLDVAVIICTAKNITYQNEVESWLSRYSYLALSDDIMYRSINDNRPSVFVKKELLDSIKTSYDVICAYDDRKDICDMYEKQGIKAVLVECEDKHQQHKKMHLHLCISCRNTYPDCSAEGLEFGDGKGNDNIIKCDSYVMKNIEPDNVGYLDKIQESTFGESDQTINLDVPIILNSAAQLFEAKNIEYGDAYKRHGKIMKEFFPDGLTLETEDDFFKFHLFELDVIKSNRIASCMADHQDHPDSWEDKIIYSAMAKESINE